MNYKIFTQEIDNILKDMNTDKLIRCIHGIARKTPENKRLEFLQSLEDSVEIKEKGIDKIELKRNMSDNKVQDKIKEILDMFKKIDEGELYFSAQSYEDYSSGYWSSDEVFEYEDNMGIGKIFSDAAVLAHDCMNDCRYKEAVQIFNLVINSVVEVVDENGGDNFEIELEEMVDEHLVNINLRILALEVLYSNYQLKSATKCIGDLYEYLKKSYFKEIHIEDIFSKGREELKDTESFWEAWINFLIKEEGQLAARLLKEALLYYKGVGGLAAFAKSVYQEHPSIYLAALLEYEKKHDYVKMKEVGLEALEKLDEDLRIRGEIALKTAQASHCTQDKNTMKKCWYEGFYSNSTTSNYLRLFFDEGVKAQYKVLAEKHIEGLEVLERYYYTTETSELEKNAIDEYSFKNLAFFKGDFDKIHSWCLEQKKSLGWTGSFIETGISLMMLYLYEGEYLRKGICDVAKQIARNNGYHKSNNLIFATENLVFENDVIDGEREAIFWDIFCKWRRNYAMDSKNIDKYISWLESVIEKRVDAIVGGTFRRKYGDVALLLSALGEVMESRGIKSKRSIVDKYVKKYPRHSAFRSEIRVYSD